MQLSTLFLSTLPLLALSRPVDWKPDPAECALCPITLHHPYDNGIAWEDKFTDKNGLCTSEEGYEYPGYEYLNRCHRKLGDSLPGSIVEPPYGDFVAPLSHHDPNLGFGTNVPAEARKACEVAGTKYGLLDRKSLRKWIDEREEEAAKRLEPCDPDMMKSCCRNNGTIDRVCWLKEHPKQQSVEREKQMFDDIFDIFTNPEHAAEVATPDAGAEIERRQLLPFPEMGSLDGCGSWTVTSKIQLGIPDRICEELRQDLWDRLPAVAPELWPFFIHAQKDDDLKDAPKISRRQAKDQAERVPPGQCCNWTDLKGIEHPIPGGACWKLNVVQDLDEDAEEAGPFALRGRWRRYLPFPFGPARRDAADTDSRTQAHDGQFFDSSPLLHCGNWTNTAGAEHPISADICGILEIDQQGGGDPTDLYPYPYPHPSPYPGPIGPMSLDAAETDSKIQPCDGHFVDMDPGAAPSDAAAALAEAGATAPSTLAGEGDLGGTWLDTAPGPVTPSQEDLFGRIGADEEDGRGD